MNRVRVITTDGYISHYAGAKPKCDCRRCSCRNDGETTATKATLSNPVSLAVTPDGVLHIADHGLKKVFSVVSELPKPRGRHYE